MCLTLYWVRRIWRQLPALDREESSFFSHYDPAMVEWFVKMVEERKKNHDSAREIRQKK